MSVREAASDVNKYLPLYVMEEYLVVGRYGASSDALMMIMTPTTKGLSIPLRCGIGVLRWGVRLEQCMRRLWCEGHLLGNERLVRYGDGKHDLHADSNGTICHHSRCGKWPPPGGAAPRRRKADFPYSSATSTWTISRDCISWRSSGLKKGSSSAVPRGAVTSWEPSSTTLYDPPCRSSLPHPDHGNTGRGRLPPLPPGDAAPPPLLVHPGLPVCD